MKGQGNLGERKVQIPGKIKKPPPEGWLASEYFVLVTIYDVLDAAR